MPLADFLTSISGLDGTTSLADILQRKVERAFLQNLHTGRSETFLVNPSTLDESYEARYKRHGSIGLSHERLQFVGNTNVKWPIEVFFDQLVFENRKARTGVSKKGDKTRHTNEPNDVERWRRFLISLVYPRRAQRLPQASPAPVLFFWPGMISTRVRVMKVSFSHALFETGTPRARAYTARIMLEEEPLERIFADDILESGTFRPWAASARPRRG